MPEFWLIAGINGAGKSTIGSNHPDVKELTSQSPILNPDLPVTCFQDALGISRAESNYAVVVAVEALVDKRIKNKKSVCVETVLSTKKYLKHVQTARQCGFVIGMIYVTLPSVEIAITRVLDRQKLGGHHVPEDKIHERWPRCHANLKEFAPYTDILYIYSNRDKTPVLVAMKNINGLVQVLEPGVLPEIEQIFKFEN